LGLLEVLSSQYRRNERRNNMDGNDLEFFLTPAVQWGGAGEGWPKSRKLGKLAGVGLQYLLRVLVSNTGPLPTHAVTISSGAPGAMIGPRMAGRTHG
ncbi:MAG: hypothetical protein ACQESR_31365, partial [Planctomycetota bacterium]